MSELGRTEVGGGKPPKPSKKKKDEEGGKEGTSRNLPKAIIGKLNIPKKIKKAKETAVAETSLSSVKESPLQKLQLSEETSAEFIKTEGDVYTSTPVKPPRSPVKSENGKLLEAEGRRPQPASPKRELSRRHRDTAHEGQDTNQRSQDVTRKVEDSPLKNPDAKPKFQDSLDNSTDDNRDEEGSESSKSSSMETAFHSAEPEAQSGHKKECLYKILVIGELGTGKTSIIKRYVHQFFSQHYRATIGVDFALKVLNWDQNTIIRLQLWDIAGQERFGNMTRVYYKEAVGAFIVFDVTRAATFDAVVKWKQDLDAKVQLADGSPIPCVLLANKCDQQKEGIVNNPNKMNEYCEEHKFTAWFETSAKENINIEEAAKTLVDQIVRNDSTNENGRNGTRDLSKFPLETSEDFSERKNACNC